MSFLTRLLQSVLPAIPFECAICHAWPSPREEQVTGVCSVCLARYAKSPLFPAPAGIARCAAALAFEPPWSALIARYKFTPEPGLARLFADLLLRESSVQTLLSDADIVMPIPLARERLQQRGFNQALWLCRALALGEKLDPHTLVRIRHTTPQRTLGQKARKENVAHAFALIKPEHRALNEPVQSFKAKRVLLVDDILTTGATLSAAAEPIHRAGAASVDALVIARTPL